MITTEIKKEIDQTLKYYEKDHYTREAKRAGKRVALLTKCLYYLETNPKEEFIDESIALVKKQIDFIKQGYNAWINSTPEARGLKKPKAAYESEMGLKNLRQQLATLIFLKKSNSSL